jgi:hypothetical protein
VRRTTRFVEEFAELGADFRYYGANPCKLGLIHARSKFLPFRKLVKIALIAAA